MRLRALIVDDEPLACERLRKMLEPETAVQVIGICADGREALAAVQRDAPDLVFLDVRMPEMDGFAFIKAVSPSPLPLIIVVTAYDQFAVRAFEAQAVDYLLKPFNRECLRQTLQRAQERMQALRTTRLHRRLAALRQQAPSPAPPDRLTVRENGRILLINLDDIDWMRAADNYVELHVGRSEHLLLSTLTALEARLAPTQFLRISRSTLVNLSRVREVRFDRHGGGMVVLQNGVELPLSRSHRHKLDQLLDK